MEASTLTTDNLIAILSDPQQRSRLQKAMSRKHGNDLTLSNRYAELARTCTATPEQLHMIVKELLAFKHRYDELLCCLVFHPAMSEQTLFLLCEKRRCIAELGHRSGPQALLERIAATYRYREAITTLALRYYSLPEYPTEAFAAFLREHSDDAMLRGNILRATKLPPDKWKIVQEVFADTEPKSKI